jgi:23S rRNA (adenine2503-C2)-methyltransferase
MSKRNLMGLTITELEGLLTGIGEKPYRGRQLFQWLYGHGRTDISEVTNLSGRLRRELADRYVIRGLALEKRMRSADGAEKFAFKLEDGHLVEAVLIPEDDRTTVCLSSQAWPVGSAPPDGWGLCAISPPEKSSGN